MKFGLAFASSIGIEGPEALELCREAEALGFDSVWGGEHVVLPTTIDSRYPYTVDGKIPALPDTPVPDPLIWLAFVAAAAPTLRLGTCVLIVPQRNPLVLARELATLDRLSGGRVELGIGVGWMREEFDCLGVPWDRRGARNDEYIAAMQALWAAPHAEFHGEFVDFGPATCSPRPIQKKIPIHVGGDTQVALRRAVRIADGFFPGERDATRLAELIGRLQRTAVEHDRDPKTIEINAIFAGFADPAGSAEKFVELGVDRAMVPAFAFAAPGGIDRMRGFAEKVMPRAGG